MQPLSLRLGCARRGHVGVKPPKWTHMLHDVAPKPLKRIHMLHD
nr:MAG TPA: hypothetical protein [Caudoviricetes sp.]